MKLIVDTDAGIDDAIALLMLLAQPDLQLLAISSVAGNVSLLQATQNIKTILDITNAPATPIYQGCARPLLRYAALDAMDIHGDDGLGGAGRTNSPRPVEAEPASLALLRLARQYTGRLTLLTLGPLTNIAVAIRLDPTFLTHFDRIVMMAGAVDVRGNTSAAAEFNIVVDPEAAHIVFDACHRTGVMVQLISWEATLAHPLTPETWAEIIEGDSPVARMAQTMTVFLNERRAEYNEPHILWPDPLAAAIVCRPEIILSQEARSIKVEIGHTLTRGQTLVDYRRRPDKPPNTQIIREVDGQQFRDLLKMAVHNFDGF